MPIDERHEGAPRQEFGQYRWIHRPPEEATPLAQLCQCFRQGFRLNAEVFMKISALANGFLRHLNPDIEEQLPRARRAAREVQLLVNHPSRRSTF
jgi:hypothetical protein